MSPERCQAASPSGTMMSRRDAPSASRPVLPHVTMFLRSRLLQPLRFDMGRDGQPASPAGDDDAGPLDCWPGQSCRGQWMALCPCPCCHLGAMHPEKQQIIYTARATPGQTRVWFGLSTRGRQAGPQPSTRSAVPAAQAGFKRIAKHGQGRLSDRPDLTGQDRRSDKVFARAPRGRPALLGECPASMIRLNALIALRLVQLPAQMYAFYDFWGSIPPWGRGETALIFFFPSQLNPHVLSGWTVVIIAALVIPPLSLRGRQCPQHHHERECQGHNH